MLVSRISVTDRYNILVYKGGTEVVLLACSTCYTITLEKYMNAMQLERYLSVHTQYITIKNYYLVYYFDKYLKVYKIEKYFAKNRKFIEIKIFFKQSEFKEYLNKML